MHHPCPFSIGELVTWSVRVPSEWKFLHTPGPMIVVNTFYQDGIPNNYARRFGMGGMGFLSGWILEIEYEADSTSYYDPPLSILFGKKRIVKLVHEVWLVRA